MHAPLRQLPQPSLQPRSRDRRKRDNQRRPVTHIALPGYEIARAVPKLRETIAAFLRRQGWALKDAKHGWQFRNGLPTILEINGEPILRRDWRKTRIAANDNVRFISKPLGGRNGKQILGLVALVAVSAFAMWAGPAVAGLVGATGALGTVVGGVVTAGIAIGGSLLINSLTAPKLGATNAPTASQIYTAQAQGNTPRLGQPLPVGYGREKLFPDFAASPWSEFVGNDQYENVLLSIGMGKYSYEEMFVDDTPCWNPTDGVLPTFSSMQVAFYAPGEEVTLFPTNVAQAAEVTGQTLPNPNVTPWIGPFIANPAGTKAQALAIDFVFPAGCFTIDKDSGEFGAAFVGLVAEYRPVDDAGAPIGDFTTLFSTSRIYNSQSPIRDSVKIPVGDGRYEVRFRRTNAPLNSDVGNNEVVWAGLRAFLKGNNSYPDVSTIAIRIKATQATQGSFRFGVLRTRILPVWNVAAGQFVEQPTRSPLWAFYDMATNAQYGAGVTLPKVDFNTIVSIADQAEARGDHFDYTFTAGVAPADAFDKALTVARSKHCWLGDVVSVVRDEWRDVPSMLLTDREIVRGTTQISMTMLGEDDPDAVVLEYIDENTWRPAQVQYPPNSDTFVSANATPIQIDGIVNREHAFREAAFYYRSALYRRENVQIGTEYEGRALTFGSTVRLQSELPQDYGQAGAVLSRSGDELTLDPVPVWADTGQHYIRVRRANGKFIGPIKVAKGDDDSIAVVDVDDLANVESTQGVTLDQALGREDGGEYPSFELGIGEDQSRVCLLVTGQPNGPNCTLNFVVDDPRVHDTDIGDPPFLPTPQYPENKRAPDVVFLTAKFRQGVAEPVLDASWWPAEGARYYTAEISYDAMMPGVDNDTASWIKIYEGSDNKFSERVDRAALRLRVQATADRSGAYAQFDLEAPTIVIAPNTVNVESMIAGLRDLVTTQFGLANDQINSAIQLISAVVAQQAGTNQADKQQVIERLAAAKDKLGASIEEVKTVAVSTESALAEFQQTTSATLEEHTAQIEETSTAVATIDGKLAASWGVKVDVDGNVGGLELLGDGTTVAFTILGNIFRVVFPGIDPTTVFQIANIDGEQKAVLNVDLFSPKSITAAMIDVAELKSVSADFGDAEFSGVIRGTNGKMIIDLNNVRQLFSD